MADRRFSVPTLQEVVTVTVGLGSIISGIIKLGGWELLGLHLPTVTSTSLTFSGSTDGTNFVAIKRSAGTAVSLTIASNTIVNVDPTLLAGCIHLKVTVDTAEAAARSLKCIVKKRF
jgi:hypothetical protein